MSDIDLAGDWALTDASGKYACAYAIPGDVHSALIAAKLIPHPYEGTNEIGARWVADTEWTASREFVWDGVAGEAGWYLDIDFLDTCAEVRVNGMLVLSASNCFLRYRPDVSKALKAGTNRIDILFKSNTAEANRRQAAQPFFVPFAAQNTPIPNGNMLRKPHCHFGWDWNLAICPLGLYGRIELKHTRDAQFRFVEVQQTHNANGSVDVQVNAVFEAATGEFLPAAIVTLAGDTQRLEPEPGQRIARTSTVFHIAEPKLWWPAGHGEQYLYDLTVKLGDQTITQKIGLRTLELITTPDPEAVPADCRGAGFNFRVNGRDIFTKGANWIPADALPSACTPELTERLLRAAVDANMNMIRIWGGGTYEQDWFYDLCDQLGLLIWHDFMFSCSLYPATPEFLAEVDAEVRYQVERLGHHACIALWCGDNELLGALHWFEESKKDRDRYLVAYDRLNRTIEESMKSIDSTGIWWPSSPSPGPMNFGDAWHDDRSGDMHFWSVWHEGRSFEHYRDVTPRFCSEFGFQSFPSLPAIRTFATPHDMNIASPVMEAHQKNAGGNARIAETMFRYFRFPMTFEDFVYVSQVQQGLAIRTAVEFWRSLKPHCMGTLYWQLNDTWPVASWSSLDHGGAWKLMHYMARDFYAPIAAVAVPAKDGMSIGIVGINDTGTPTAADVTVFALSVDGTRRELGRHQAELPPDKAIEIDRVAASDIPADAILFISTRIGDSSSITRHFAPKPYKAYELRDPAIAVTKASTPGGLAITIAASNPAFFVALECDAPGHFSHAAFDLLPGEPRTVQFNPQRAGDLTQAAATLRLRDLYSATCR